MVESRRYVVRLHASSAPAIPVRDGMVIGRAPEADLRLESSAVSREHARIRITGRGPMIDDLGSRNGVLVNDHPVVGTSPLAHGDRILLGDQVLSFVDLDREEVSAILIVPTDVLRPSTPGAVAITQGAVHITHVVLDGCARALGDDDTAEAERAML